MNTVERFAKLTPNKQSLLTVWLDQHKNGSGAAHDADKQLVAYVVLKNGTRDTAPLREYLRGKTPAYMVPDSIVPLDSLPLTTNGKIDRARLSQISKTSHMTDDNFVAPRTELEEELAGLWAEILKVERLGINDNFFDLGGHSLLATRLIFRLREHFHVDLPLRALFEAPTVATIAPVIVQGQIEQIDSEDMVQVLSAVQGS
jgi:acyl carrier protein